MCISLLSYMLVKSWWKLEKLWKWRKQQKRNKFTECLSYFHSQTFGIMQFFVLQSIRWHGFSFIARFLCNLICFCDEGSILFSLHCDVLRVVRGSWKPEIFIGDLKDTLRNLCQCNTKWEIKKCKAFHPSKQNQKLTVATQE